MMEQQIIIAGDIGGTKTNLGLFSGPVDNIQRLAVSTYPSQDAGSPEELIERFLDEQKRPRITHACFGVAGPVINGIAKAVNLPWDVSQTSIENRFGFVWAGVVNDLVAMAYSIPHLKQSQLQSIYEPGQQISSGNMGLIAAGTGLGEALLIQENGTYVACPSEGGHKDFAPRNELEFRLHRYLAAQYGHVSFDRVLSGRGLVDVYSFLLSESNVSQSEWLAEEMATGNPSAVISQSALGKKDTTCEKALDLFIEIYGAETGNIALQGVTTGGMYIGGGIAPQIASALKSDSFITAYKDKGRLQSLVETIPVRLILDPEAPLWGAAARALQKMQL